MERAKPLKGGWGTAHPPHLGKRALRQQSRLLHAAVCHPGQGDYDRSSRRKGEADSDGHRAAERTPLEAHDHTNVERSPSVHSGVDALKDVHEDSLQPRTLVCIVEAQHILCKGIDDCAVKQDDPL
eukprot:7390860-Prymnesium_polylepis.1